MKMEEKMVNDIISFSKNGKAMVKQKNGKAKSVIGLDSL